MTAGLRSPSAGDARPSRLDRTSVRFLAVGVLNTAYGYAVFVALELGLGDWLHYLGVLLGAHVISVLTAFVLYRRFVFTSSGGPLLHELARFWSVYLVALGVNAVVLLIGVDGLGLPVLVAQALALVITAVLSFVGHSRFSFRSGAATPDVEPR